MSQSSQQTGSNRDDQIEALTGEIQRLRRLCLKLMSDPNASPLHSNKEKEMSDALQSAWKELEVKQRYLESAFAEVDKLRHDLSDTGRQSHADQAAEITKLTASLHEAWAEIARKQGYLEEAVATAKALKEEMSTVGKL